MIRGKYSSILKETGSWLFKAPRVLADLENRGLDICEPERGVICGIIRDTGQK